MPWPQEYINATNPAMSVGEFWTDCNYDEAGSLLYDQDSHRQAIVDWCDATGGTSTAFDFTTKARHSLLGVGVLTLGR